MLSLALYENPLFSLYVFLGWMTVIHYNDLTKVPPFLVSVLILKLIQNYSAFGRGRTFKNSFSPLSLQETCMTLFDENGNHGDNPMTETHQGSEDDNLWLNREVLTQRLNDTSSNVKDHSEFPFFENANYREFSTLLNETSKLFFFLWIGIYVFFDLKEFT
jgi:hypothetical protein